MPRDERSQAVFFFFFFWLFFGNELGINRSIPTRPLFPRLDGGRPSGKRVTFACSYCRSCV